MKNDAKGVPHTTANAADSVPEINSVSASRSLHGPVMYSKGYRIALPQRHHFDTTLHARTLFSQDKLSASEVDFWFGEENCNLEREREVTVDILMQAVEVV